jgi:nicotinamidase-related amidase
MADSALIVIDMLNPYQHDDADVLVESVETTIEPIRELLRRAEAEDVEVIYVNDN